MALQIVSTVTGSTFKHSKAAGFFKVRGKVYAGDLYTCDNPVAEILIVSKEVAITDLDVVAGSNKIGQ